MGDATAVQGCLAAVASIPSLKASPHAQALAKQLLELKALPANSFIDALHIAIASSYGADYLLTWNFKHINNAATKTLIQKTVEAFGFNCPILCTPEELNGD